CPNPAKDTVTVTVTDIPVAIAGNDANGKICAAGPVQLFANYIDNATYEWRLQGSTTIISTQQNPVVFVNATSVYELTIKLDGCVSNIATTRIDITTKPQISSVVGNFNVCEGDSVKVTINFLNNVDGEYSISGGDLSTGNSNINGKTIVFIIAKSKLTNSGYYKLRITTTDNCDFDYDSIFNLAVNPIPVAVASNGGRVCKGDTGMLFANTISNAIYEWRINGLTNIISIDQNPKVFNVDTTTTFELTIKTNGCVSQPSYTTIEVYPIPLITITSDTLKVCEGDPIDLKAVITAPTYLGNIRFNWTGPNNYVFNGLTKSGLQTSTLITNSNFGHKGTYTINAEFEDVPNCGASPKTIYVDVIPKLKLQILGNDQCCYGDTFKLRVVPDNLKNYVWTNGNGVVIATNVININLPSNSPLAVSPIKVTADNQGCKSDGEINIIINKLPVISASNNGPICSGDTVTLTTDLIANATYEWRIVGNNTVISTKNTFKYPGLTQTTTFTVTVRLPNCNQQVVASTTVIVNQGPEVKNLTGDGSYCLGSDVTLNASGVAGAGNVTYIWVFLPTQQPVFIAVAPKGGPFPLEIKNIQLSDAGTYLLVVQDLLTGCTTIAGTVNIQVKDLPIKPVISAIDDTLCVGQSLVLNCNNYTGNVKYQWFRNDTLIGTTSVNSFTLPNITVAQRGLYSVIVMVDGCTSEKSDAIFIEVFGQGMPFTITNPTSADKPACQGSSLTVNAMVMNGATYMWFGPNGMIPNATGPLLILSPVTKATEGLYYVKITKNECATVISDTIFLHVADKPIANTDNYTVDYNTPHTGTVLSNDILGNNKNVSIKLLQHLKMVQQQFLHQIFFIHLKVISSVQIIWYMRYVLKFVQMIVILLWLIIL
ncbi:MAG: immunoglobulin domain-containing protein, partial [Saprospiraceae bacterium]|nr:immunoglobulin domain-containing protein [Saprospiraceae bacterium]